MTPVAWYLVVPGPVVDRWVTAGIWPAVVRSELTMWGDRPSFVREALFGGVGAVTVTDLLAGADAPPFAAALGCALDPGGAVGRHRQQEHPELVIGVDGDGEAEVDGVVRPLGPGDLVFLPLGSVLAIRNRSATAPLRYLIVKATAVTPPR
ncbi:MAG: cupin domain-containing protein [Myxococcota bacterium]